MQTTKNSGRRPPAKRFAQIERIVVCGVPARMAPLALHWYADKFYTAACSLPRSGEGFEPVRLYLVCHAIELALKAFLSLRGAAMPELADSSGHRLNALLKKAEGTDFHAAVLLAEAHCDAIRKAATYYARKVYEYPAVGEAAKFYPKMPKPPHIDRLFEAASILVNSLRQLCLEAE